MIGACIFADFAAEPYILLIQRSSNQNKTGKWEISDGLINYNNPALLYTVIREIFKEIKLYITNVHYLIIKYEFQEIKKKYIK
jgi:hypothetical protein